MGDTKLAKNIYSLAMEVENGTNEEAGGAGYEASVRKTAAQKTAEKMVQYQDPAGNLFMLPYALVGNAPWMYSPYDKSRAERQAILNLSLTGKAESLFGQPPAPVTTSKEAATYKTADKMVQFRDDTGRTFVLPYENVGYARWAYSPFDRSRAQRVDIINVQMTGRLEESLGLGGE